MKVFLSKQNKGLKVTEYLAELTKKRQISGYTQAAASIKQETLVPLIFRGGANTQKCH